MSEWKEYKLGDFMEFNPKISLKKDVIARKITMDQLIPYSRDIYSWTYEPYSGGAKFQNGDTIMARITPCLENGKHAYISLLDENEIAFGSTEYIVMRGKKGVSDNKFVYYLTHYPSFKNSAIKSMVGSSGRQRAQTSVLENMTMNLPSLYEQIRIAEILSEIDDKIAVNRRICENLEAQAQALFKHWFIDFAPFKNGNFVESELGMIPEGWRVGSLFDIAEVHDSKRKPLSGMQRAKMKKVYPYYGATEQMDMVDDYIFDGRYVLMGEDGSVVRENGLPYIQYVWGKIWVNNHAHVLTGKNGFTTEMLIPFLTKYNIKGLVTGAVQAKLNQANMAKISLAIPPISILENISRLFESLYDTYRTCCTEMVTLSTLRDTLLPKLMSGQIKV